MDDQIKLMLDSLSADNKAYVIKYLVDQRTNKVAQWFLSFAIAFLFNVIASANGKSKLTDRVHKYISAYFNENTSGRIILYFATIFVASVVATCAVFSLGPTENHYLFIATLLYTVALEKWPDKN